MSYFFNKFRKLNVIKVGVFSFVAQLLRVHFPSQKMVWTIFFQLLILFIVLGFFFFWVEFGFITLFKKAKII